MMAIINKRTRKWVKWTIAWKSIREDASSQPSPNVVLVSSSPHDTSGTNPSLTQAPTQLASGGNQPPQKNIPLDKNCLDGSVPMIGLEVEAKKKKVEEIKDIVVIVVLSSQISPI